MGNCCAGSSNDGEVNMHNIAGGKVALSKAPKSGSAQTLIQRDI